MGTAINVLALATACLSAVALVLWVMVWGLRAYTAETLRRVRELERRVSGIDATLDDHGIYSVVPPVGLDAPPHRER